MTDIQEYTKLDTYRYERKYTVEKLLDFQVENIIKFHPALFSEIFNERYINNVYFDTERFDFYYDNVNGKDNRIKFRIRWYGDLFGEIKKPILELKIKKGVVGTKRSFFLKPFYFDNNFNVNNFIEIINKSDLPDEVKLKISNLKPTLINRYKRKYFRDASGDYRITTDKEISYFSVANRYISNPVIDTNKIVVELKYDYQVNDEAQAIGTNLPFRLTKNSKYVTGIEKFYEVID